MKIKSRPQDFVVEELLDLPAFSPDGSHFIYKLDKKGLSTLEVVNHLAHRFKIKDKRIGFAGMKDKYALTSQYLSILGKDLKEIKEENFALTPVGRSARPIGSDLLKGNSFVVTLRSLEKESISRLINNLDEVSRYGFPNYFGEQRFGSVRHRGGFIAKHLILNDYEGALKIYLSGWSPKDRPEVKEFRKHVSKHWGEWEECLRFAPRSDERRIITFLRDYPKDFVRAVNLVNPRLLSIFIAAYQSYLWNEMAKEFIKLYISQSELMRFYNSSVEMFFYKSLPVSLFKEFLSVLIPLVDLKVEFQNVKIREIARRVIEQEGVEIENFRLNKIKRAFFKSVLRKVIAIPEELEVSEPAHDEINTGKFKLTISFELPSGSYASVLIRRLGVA